MSEKLTKARATLVWLWCGFAYLLYMRLPWAWLTAGRRPLGMWLLPWAGVYAHSASYAAYLSAALTKETKDG